MADNRGVVYLGNGQVEVQSIPFPKMQNPQGKPIHHGVILRVVSTNICGSDQHMVRGRTTAQTGLVLGHEITGEVIEAGRDVEHLKVGDLVSVPFNVACGRCRSCKEQNTGVCLTVNPARPGGAYGYVDMGDWVGGQAEYVLVPYADFNLLKLPYRDASMEKIRDLTCLSDILPTGYHGAVTAGVGPGSTVYIAGAGPVGLAAAASARLLGAAVVIVGDVNPIRLAHAKAQGFEIADLSKDTPLHEQIAELLGEPEVDCAVDAVGFEARGHGHDGVKHEAPATVLNSLMGVVRVAGKIGSGASANRLTIATGGKFRFNPQAGLATAYAVNLAYIYNLGSADRLHFHTWSVQNGILLLRATDMPGSETNGASVIDNVVSLKAQYGFDNRTIANYNPNTPGNSSWGETTTSGMQVGIWSATMIDADGDGLVGGAGDYKRVAAVRLAVVARSKSTERPGASGVCTATTVLTSIRRAATNWHSSDAAVQRCSNRTDIGRSLSTMTASTSSANAVSTSSIMHARRSPYLAAWKVATRHIAVSTKPR